VAKTTCWCLLLDVLHGMHMIHGWLFTQQFVGLLLTRPLENEPALLAYSMYSLHSTAWCAHKDAELWDVVCCALHDQRQQQQCKSSSLDVALL
jgi:hypothetical protein